MFDFTAFKRREDFEHGSLRLLLQGRAARLGGGAPQGRVERAQRFALPQQRLHLGTRVGLGRRRLLGLLHEAVLVVLIDVEAAEAGRERAPRHA